MVSLSLFAQIFDERFSDGNGPSAVGRIPPQSRCKHFWSKKNFLSFPPRCGLIFFRLSSYSHLVWFELFPLFHWTSLSCFPFYGSPPLEASPCRHFFAIHRRKSSFCVHVISLEFDQTSPFIESISFFLTAVFLRWAVVGK